MKMIGRLFDLYTQAMDNSFLDIRSIGIDLLFLSVFTAVCLLLGFLLGKIFRRRLYKTVFLLVATGVSACLEPIMRNLPSYVLRLREILDNVNYIMSYKDNLSPFLAALGLTSENASKVKSIIYYMNGSEWKKVETGTGYMNWYMEGIHRSLDRTVRVFGFHVGRTGYEQRFTAAALLISVFLAGVAFRVFHIRKRIWRLIFTAAVFVGSFVLCEILSFGTILYFVLSLSVLLLLLYSINSIWGRFK